MSEGEPRRFTPTALFIVGALLIWLTNFVIVYVVAAVACARGFAHLRLLGLPLVPLVTTLSCIAACAGTVVLLRRGAQSLRNAQNEQVRFIGFLVVATSGLCLAALVLIALPPWLASACNSS